MEIFKWGETQKERDQSGEKKKGKRGTRQDEDEEGKRLGCTIYAPDLTCAMVVLIVMMIIMMMMIVMMMNRVVDVIGLPIDALTNVSTRRKVVQRQRDEINVEIEKSMDEMVRIRWQYYSNVCALHLHPFSCSYM